MSERIVLPGPRDARGTLDRADSDGSSTAKAVVIACPPHPQYGGDRSDPRLVAVADALTARGIDCLRIDYGPWDEGRGERVDVHSALGWARKRYDRVGLFGYSFGGAVAILAAAEADEPPYAVSTLAPGSELGNLDVVAAIENVTASLQVIYGTRDDVVDVELVAERTREFDGTVESLPADHFFVGQQSAIGTLVGDFLAAAL